VFSSRNILNIRTEIIISGGKIVKQVIKHLKNKLKMVNSHISDEKKTIHDHEGWVVASQTRLEKLITLKSEIEETIKMLKT